MLACEDKELNQWVSLKKAVQIRYCILTNTIRFVFHIPIRAHTSVRIPCACASRVCGKTRRRAQR